MENIISMVRTFAPLTSAQTVSKVNTYLPAVEKVSTLLGMYSFISRAQNFRPIQAFDAKTPTDKITALLKNGNIPIAKLVAQPLLANNMDKIIGAVAMNIAKNGGLNEMLSSLTNGNKSSFNEVLSSLAAAGNKENSNDLSSLMEAFMPMINNIMSSSEQSEEPDKTHEHSDSKVFKSAQFDYSIEDDDSNPVNTPPSAEKNIKHEKHVQKPIRIRQRRR